MSSFTDPSSIVLIVGAICILLFILHGLWFSGKPQNRQLKTDAKRDQELRKSNNVGKVRIVTAEVPTNEELSEMDLTVGKINKANVAASHADKNATNAQATRHMALPEDYDDGYSYENTASVSVNSMGQSAAAANEALLTQSGGATGNELAPADSFTHAPSAEPSSSVHHQKVYEIIVAAEPGRPYQGLDIEELCNQYGFIQGFIKENLKIYFVYENAATKQDEVFRICSMEAPYYFPENMQDFKTSAIALYMACPVKGKAYAYFKALRMATEIFIAKLGGQIQDQHRRPLDEKALDAIAAELQQYDDGINAIEQ